MNGEIDIIAEMLKHSPALIVAVPLLGAFITPLIGKINDKLRNCFAIFIVVLTASILICPNSSTFSRNELKIASKIGGLFIKCSVIDIETQECH